MDTCDRLYHFAKLKSIEVIPYPLKTAEALSEPIDGTCAIAIDPRKLSSRADETVKLAHELGHCMRHAFYSESTPFETMGRCEYRANAWAVNRTLPFPLLLQAIHNGITELWELSEHFGVTEDFMLWALEYYTERRGYKLWK